MKLICIPHAGGFASYYKFIKDAALPNVDDVNLCDFPTRNLKDPDVKNFYVLAEEIAEKLIGYIEDDDYVLFGHSMGAFLVYEIGLYLMKHYNKAPSFVFISGQRPPNRVKPEHYTDALNTGLDAFISLGGLTSEVLNTPLVLNYFYQMMQYDTRTLATYRPSLPNPQYLLPAGMVLCGKDDQEAEIPFINDWANFFNEWHGCKLYEGSHFYIEQNKEHIIMQMSSILENLS